MRRSASLRSSSETGTGDGSPCATRKRRQASAQPSEPIYRNGLGSSFIEVGFIIAGESGRAYITAQERSSMARTERLPRAGRGRAAAGCRARGSRVARSVRAGAVAAAQRRPTDRRMSRRPVLHATVTVIDYLVEENRILKEQLGSKRLAASRARVLRRALQPRPAAPGDRQPPGHAARMRPAHRWRGRGRRASRRAASQLSTRGLTAEALATAWLAASVGPPVYILGRTTRR